MNPKLAIALLVILLLLFIVGLGAGIGQDDEAPADLDAGWLESLGTLIGGNQALAAEDLTPSTPAACRQQFEQGVFQLQPGTACLLVIGESSDPIRTLALRLRQGSAAEVQMVQNGDGGISADQILDAGDFDFEAQFLEEGGAVQVQCLNSGSTAACLLDLN